jgi:hypothetical protein
METRYQFGVSIIAKIWCFWKSNFSIMQIKNRPGGGDFFHAYPFPASSAGQALTAK